MDEREEANNDEHYSHRQTSLDRLLEITLP